jgi:LPS-assembly protein
MINKKFFTFVFLVFFIITNSKSEVLNLTAKEIIATEKGNIITAIGDPKFIEPNKIIITADRFVYNKKSLILEAYGNVNAFDLTNNMTLESSFAEYHRLDEELYTKGSSRFTDPKQLIITADEFIYFKKTSLIKAEGNVKAFDLIKDVNMEANFAEYYKLEKKLYTFGETTAIIQNSYFIESRDILFDQNKSELSSEKFSKANDSIGNEYIFDNFIFNNNTNLLKGSNVEYRDIEENIYKSSEGIINIKNNKMLGKDINVKFRNDMFGNKKNDPRIKGSSFTSGNNISIIKNGVFTTCKQNDDCPPWLMTSKETTHDKTKKTIAYKNAWLKIYDVPVMYFPKFFHPDPSVKRQSGLLTPRTSNNSLLGGSLTMPYFYAIDDNSDLTFTPRMFSHEKYVLQTEYRKVTKNVIHQMDVSFNKGYATETNTKDNSRSHIYSNTLFDFNTFNQQESSLELNVERVSNDTYLDLFTIKSPIVKNTSTFNSYLKYKGIIDEVNFDVAFQVYESADVISSDRYEYIYPNFNLSKSFNFLENLFDSSTINTYGHQKKIQTNVFEGRLINDLILNNNHFLKKGFDNNTKIILKNVNSKGRNSSKYKDKQQSELLSMLSYNITYPLQKLNENISYLTPKMTFMHSPNKTKNLKTLGTQIEINNIFAMNRIGDSDAIEGGSSMTLGAEYKKVNEEYKDILSLDIGAIFKNKRDDNLPLASTLGKKTSDVVGNILISPNDFLSLNYDFSIDNNLSDINYTYLEPQIKINNFVASFEFLEQSELMGGASYLSEKFGYTLNENSSILYSTRKNKKTNLREFYNLIYQYENDCLTASLRYNKSYYANNDIKPAESMMFTITIIPLGQAQTKNLIPAKGWESLIGKE